MNLADITILSNGPVLELIQWLQGHNCLANPLRCVPCNHAMHLTERNRGHVDGYLWFVYSSDLHAVVMKYTWFFTKVLVEDRTLELEKYFSMLVGWSYNISGDQ